MRNNGSQYNDDTRMMEYRWQGRGLQEEEETMVQIEDLIQMKTSGQSLGGSLIGGIGTTTW